MAEVWPDANVSEDNLRQHIRALRQKLSNTSGAYRYIRTIPNRGYIFVADVVIHGDAEPRPAPPGEVEPLTQQTEQHQQPVQLAETSVSASSSASSPAARRGSWHTPWLIAALAMAVLIIGLVVVHFSGPALSRPVAVGRLLVRSTSEGTTPTRIALSHPPDFLAVGRSGDRVFATSAYGHTLSIIETKDGTVRTIALPRDGGPLAVGPDDLVYVGSLVNGVMVVDVGAGRVLPKILQTGGPVWSMALTPDASKLFLAMGPAGLKRLSPGSGELVQLSDRACPEHLEIDRQGQHLYLAYQCSGPGGRRGHDSVEIFDVKREVSIGIISGPPMVGGPPSVSSDGKLVLLNGQDACWTSSYDHVGCAAVPTHVFHLVRPSDGQILHTFAFPITVNGAARFLDNARFVVAGRAVSVLNVTNFNTLEKLELDTAADDLVLTPDGRGAYLGFRGSQSILYLRLQDASCAPPQDGLAMFFAADGSFDDAITLNALVPHGDVRFVPGKVGQALFLNDGSFLSIPSTGHYQVGRQEFSIAMYAKFAQSGGERVLIDWSNQKAGSGITLLKSADDRLVFHSLQSSSPLRSLTSIESGAWYQITVTRTDQAITLYINGRAEASGGAPPRLSHAIDSPVLIGARSPGQPSYNGWIDELAFYNRALTADEVKTLYEQREAGPCKP